MVLKCLIKCLFFLYRWVWFSKMLSREVCFLFIYKLFWEESPFLEIWTFSLRIPNQFRERVSWKSSCTAEMSIYVFGEKALRADDIWQIRFPWQLGRQTTNCTALYTANVNMKMKSCPQTTCPRALCSAQQLYSVCPSRNSHLAHDFVVYDYCGPGRAGKEKPNYDLIVCALVPT